ncbi:MAG TPA: hypothetical protein VGL20_01225 [Candidatus Dormibacteraeota bacterium]|jgi:hypothetical protein
MVRRAVMFAATVTLGLGAVGAVGVTHSRADSGTHCTFQHVPNLSPGLSFQSSTGTFTDPGGGTAMCSGGISGSGDYTDSGTVSGTCQGGGVAEGDPTFTIGGRTFTDHIKITFGQPSTKGGVVHADFEGSRTKGTIELTPTKGDCVLNPVTQVKGVGEFALK